MTRPTRSRSTSNAGTSEEGEIDIHNRYEVKVPLKAGLRTIGASFPKNLALDESVVPETVRVRRRTRRPSRSRSRWTCQVDGARVTATLTGAFGRRPVRTSRRPSICAT